MCLASHFSRGLLTHYPLIASRNSRSIHYLKVLLFLRRCIPATTEFFRRLVVARRPCLAVALLLVAFTSRRSRAGVRIEFIPSSLVNSSSSLLIRLFIEVLAFL